MDKYINEDDIHLYIYNNTNDDYMVNWYGKYTYGSTSYRGSSVGTIDKIEESFKYNYDKYRSKTIKHKDYPDCKYDIFYDFPILTDDYINVRADSIDEIIERVKPLLKINTPCDMYKLMSIYTVDSIYDYDYEFCKHPEETIDVYPNVPHEKETLQMYLEELEKVNKICKKNNVTFVWI